MQATNAAQADAADIEGLVRKAGEAAEFLKLIANENRLLILCQLLGHGEMSVNALAGAVGLGQSALSQHLARLREDGLVATRRDGQSIRYRIADPRALRLLETLKLTFCP